MNGTGFAQSFDTRTAVARGAAGAYARADGNLAMTLVEGAMPHDLHGQPGVRVVPVGMPGRSRPPDCAGMPMAPAKRPG